MRLVDRAAPFQCLPFFRCFGNPFDRCPCSCPLCPFACAFICFIAAAFLITARASIVCAICMITNKTAPVPKM